MIQQIDQFAPTVIKGDDVTNSIFYIRKILRELGIQSNIYAQNIDNSLINEVTHIKEYKAHKDSMLLIHYSLYYDFDLYLNNFESKKILVYHNITPYHFFEKNSTLYNLAKKGREYLSKIKDYVDGAISVSELNYKELNTLAYKNNHIIPALVDIEKIRNYNYNQELYDKNSTNFNLLFVGRIAQNKAQLDLIEIAKHYKKINNNFAFFIVGDTTQKEYLLKIKQKIKEYNLQNQVILTGKISNENLYALYRSSDVFVCMSEHEGFGIPLIESFIFDLPVIAYNSSNIADTLNRGGILFEQKDFKKIAATIELLRTNKPFKNEIINTQQIALNRYSHQEIVNKLINFLNLFNIKTTYQPQKEQEKKLKYQFEGPFDSSYSLAILNRNSALSFEKEFPSQVSLFPTEGNGDYTPNSDFLSSNPTVAKLYQNSKKAPQCEVVFRNLYPPRVTAMKGNLNILNSYGWEESAFPREYIENFNLYLDGITVMSQYVKDLLISNGVTIPIEVVGLGVEHTLTEAKPFKLNTNKSFKFLHISSCFPRKGVDILIKAYVKEFNSNDDVTLIIKTFPNPHNNVETLIKQELKTKQNPPEIILINRDLPNENITWLYKTCHTLVAPSRGEGFGLPIAEAMLHKMPVITTAFSGQMDFCSNKTASLINYTFQKAQTHLNLYNSYWAEPSQEHLQKLLHYHYKNRDSKKIQSRVQQAYKNITTNFTWDKYREKTLNFIQKLKHQPIFKPKQKLAWISTYNTKCGIATYSEFILNHLKQHFEIKIFANKSIEIIDPSKEQNVIRCWVNNSDKDNKELISQTLNFSPETILINFNFAFFSLKNLSNIIDSLKLANKRVYIIFHSVADTIVAGKEVSLKDIITSLKKADKLLVHSINDLTYLQSIGLQNINLLPHGVTYHQQKYSTKKAKNFTIASYGFLLPHKGILELIEAFNLIQKEYPNTKLLLVNSLYPIQDSYDYLKKCKNKIEKLNLQEKVKLITEFLPDEASFSILQEANLIVMPYRETKESASGAIRYALSLNKPTLCTPLNIFSDVENLVHFTQGFSSQNIANKIKELISNPKLLHQNSKKQQEWLYEHDWQHISTRLKALLS